MHITASPPGFENPAASLYTSVVINVILLKKVRKFTSSELIFGGFGLFRTTVHRRIGAVLAARAAAASRHILFLQQ